ncbi:NADP-dependent oxidoreductase [Nocardia sp. NPDC051030]|uniref:NADP-dependent oxidoreductase n=1 Tax=Nocardia sp. NPDC051030 TaxID=3155162 RepID=UPI00343BE2D1
MRAVTIEHKGDPQVLKVGEVDEFELGPNDLRVTVAAAAVNPVDLKTRSGFLSIELSYPSVLGWDVSGTVVEIGSTVTGFAVGDAVIAMIAQPAHGRGTYSERVTADAALFAPAPKGIPLDSAAAIPLGGLTAAQTLEKLTLPQGAAVLVTGAAGAVGRIAVQLLLARGHAVDGLARAGDVEGLRALGVGRVFTTVDDLPDASYLAVVDTAGVAGSIRAVCNDGQFVAIDDNEQPAPERGITPRKSYVNESGAQLAEIGAEISAGRLDIPVGRRYSFDDAATAHADFGAGGLRGKVLLLP